MTFCKISTCALCICIVFGGNLFAQQEQRVTEKRSTTDESGQTRQTTSVTETKIEDIAPTRKHIFLTSPVRLIWMYNLSYFQSVTDNIAVGGGIEAATSTEYRLKSGIGFTLEGRFYPTAKAMHGFYVAPVLNFHSLNTVETNYTPTGMPIVTNDTYTPLSLGVTTGWTLFAWNDLAIDLGVGFKHHFISAERPTPSFGYEGAPVYVGPDIFRGTVPTLRLNIGYAW